ncbi:hypothetical protein Q31a_54230 [Aureliella helgolandensis]|uniref:Uncharacterized protein n=1 Tax=Aureliella helgolandensis TaxID=2527968 RepID=A0A518GEM1_9BACT|nr:hypothetical protein Q31a_54230 [Aureliella helgolandensis]
MPPIAFLLIATFVVYILWKTRHPPWIVKIVVCPNTQLKITGAPQAKIWQIEEFFENTPSLPCCVTVYVSRDSAGRIRTRFAGNLERCQRQRIRNFMLDIL